MMIIGQRTCPNNRICQSISTYTAHCKFLILLSKNTPLENSLRLRTQIFNFYYDWDSSSTSNCWLINIRHAPYIKTVLVHYSFFFRLSSDGLQSLCAVVIGPEFTCSTVWKSSTNTNTKPFFIYFSKQLHITYPIWGNISWHLDENTFCFVLFRFWMVNKEWRVPSFNFLWTGFCCL